MGSGHFVCCRSCLPGQRHNHFQIHVPTRALPRVKETTGLIRRSDRGGHLLRYMQVHKTKAGSGAGLKLDRSIPDRRTFRREIRERTTAASVRRLSSLLTLPLRFDGNPEVNIHFVLHTFRIFSRTYAKVPAQTAQERMKAKNTDEIVAQSANHVAILSSHVLRPCSHAHSFVFINLVIATDHGTPEAACPSRYLDLRPFSSSLGARLSSHHLMSDGPTGTHPVG